MERLPGFQRQVIKRDAGSAVKAPCLIGRIDIGLLRDAFKAVNAIEAPQGSIRLVSRCIRSCVNRGMRSVLALLLQAPGANRDGSPTLPAAFGMLLPGLWRLVCALIPGPSAQPPVKLG